MDENQKRFLLRGYDLSGIVHFGDTKLYYNDNIFVIFRDKVESVGRIERDELILNNLRVSDLSFLSELPKLKKLCLSRNIISNIKPLLQLENLEELDLNNNKLHIADIIPLANLKNLRYLILYKNPGSDYDSLKPHFTRCGLRCEEYMGG